MFAGVVALVLTVRIDDAPAATGFVPNVQVAPVGHPLNTLSVVDPLKLLIALTVIVDVPD